MAQPEELPDHVIWVWMHCTSNTPSQGEDPVQSVAYQASRTSRSSSNVNVVCRRRRKGLYQFRLGNPHLLLSPCLLPCCFVILLLQLGIAVASPSCWIKALCLIASSAFVSPSATISLVALYCTANDFCCICSRMKWYLIATCFVRL